LTRIKQFAETAVVNSPSALVQLLKVLMRQ
jgi:hypothetical protein